MERSARSVRRARRVAYRQRTQNRLSMFLISMVVLMILVVVVVGSIDVRNKIEAKAVREQQVDEQIADEESRAKEIEEFEKEVQTKGWIENEAREKLGLVYEDEIMFKQE